MTDATCSVEDCSRTVYAKQICALHYWRIRTHGTADLPPKPDPYSPPWIAEVEVPTGSKAVSVVLPGGEEFTYALVDEADYDSVRKFRWRLANDYACRSIWNGGHTKVIYMHRQLTCTPAGMDTDHINRNKLDNRRVNLRSVDRSTNNYNTPPSRANTSGHKGVTFYKATGRWRAYLKHKGTLHHLGYFPTKEDAIAARIAAEYRYIGEKVSWDPVDEFR
jgi:hypothetical protein